MLPEDDYEEKRILTVEKQLEYVHFFEEKGFDMYQKILNNPVERGPVQVAYGSRVKNKSLIYIFNGVIRVFPRLSQDSYVRFLGIVFFIKIII